MDSYTIKDDRLSVIVTTECGAILDVIYDNHHLLRPFSGNPHNKLNPVVAGNFPMIPFCNRVEDNKFTFEGVDYQLERNTDWDPLYVHGEGWISTWILKDITENAVTMSLDHIPEKGAPYGYNAIQEISVNDGILSLRITLKNTMSTALLFGFGHHFFFPKTSETRLKAKAEGYWKEKDLFLPDQRLPVPDEMDFSSFSRIPDHWINNGFDGWDGSAKIIWPEWKLGICIKGDENFSDYFVFNSHKDFEPNFKDDYFCFEPMSHRANGHHLPDYGGLVCLKNGERITGVLTMKPLEWEEISFYE